MISAYKPNGGLEDRFNQHGATVDSAWDFVQTHLKQLPVVKVTSGYPQELLNIVERDPRRIYDRMASWFIRHGTMVPISTPEFLAELPVRFREMDGMVFLPEQLVDYEKARARIPQVAQAELFVSDERSAIDWLTNFLLSAHPRDRKSTRSTSRRSARPSARATSFRSWTNCLRTTSFSTTAPVTCQARSTATSRPTTRICAASTRAIRRWWRKPKIAGMCPTQTRPRTWRRSARRPCSRSSRPTRRSRAARSRSLGWRCCVRGFRSAWANKDYTTIISVANKLPEETLQEDEKLLLWYDQALTRTEER
jgi:hypothetical protein